MSLPATHKILWAVVEVTASATATHIQAIVSYDSSADQPTDIAGPCDCGPLPDIYIYPDSLNPLTS